ncbi:MAG: nuclear transport factor 2 family protein [Planctomycetes bacterium]|nr:nuclear transport factor 2 family protein [Planctomycetota bacterium]MCB9909047.1 nuclear transport factor 2 family protein [Planctomycetota bacterium]MCB9911707.1 nuclear transport factor 2 family protein [Planctomycetota bacterium]
MSSRTQHIDLVRSLYRAFADKDISSILGMLSDDIEWGEPENPFNPAGGTRKGHSGFLEWISIGKNAEDILVLSPQKMLTDLDSVAVVGHMKCRAISTGKVYESDFVHLVTLRDGKICKFQEFFDTYVAGEAFRP